MLRKLLNLICVVYIVSKVQTKLLKNTINLKVNNKHLQIANGHENNNSDGG